MDMDILQSCFPGLPFSLVGQNLTTESYDPDGAKKVLEEAGWVDSDGDGIREKDGQKLEIRWLTYPSRQELPLLAESAQATLKEIGMDVQIIVPLIIILIRKDLHYGMYMQVPW